MPEIRRKQASSIPRSVSPQLGGFRSTASLEGEAIAQFGQTAQRAVGGLLQDIKQVNDRISQQELSNEMQSKMADSIRELSIVKEGDALDGSDLIDKGKMSFEKIQSDILSKTSSGNVRDALYLQSQDMGRQYEENIFRMANKRFIEHTDNKLKEFSNQSASKILSTPGAARGDLMLGEIASYNQMLDDVSERLGVDVAEKFKKSNIEELRKTYIESAQIDEKSAHLVKATLEGRSKNPELNALFSSMDAGEKMRGMKMLDNIIERQVREFEMKMQMNLTNIKASNALGEPPSPEVFQKFTTDIMNSGMASEDKQKMLSELNIQAKVSEFSLQKPELNNEQIINGLQNTLDNFSGEPIEKLKMKEALSEVAIAEIKLRNEDPKAAVSRMKSIQALEAGKNTPNGFLKYNEQVLMKQTQLGMQPMLLSKEEGALIESQINSIGTVQGRVAVLDSIIGNYGTYSTKVLSELAARKNIPDDLVVYGMLNDQSSKEAFIKNSKNLKNLDFENVKKLTGVTKETINDKVLDQSSSLNDVLSSQSHLGSFVTQMQEQISRETRSLVLGGESAEKAAKTAYKKFVDNNYYMTKAGKTTIIAPKTAANGAQINEDRLDSFFKVSLKKENLQKIGAVIPEGRGNKLFWEQNPNNIDELLLYSLEPEGERLVQKKDKSGKLVPVSESFSKIYSYSTSFEEDVNQDSKTLWDKRTEFFSNMPKGLTQQVIQKKAQQR